ncbi:chemotaxis protein CheW [Aliikangiella coralliicola]|uniref:CheW-like domain-containing protein n=1 Tax=Aliikangiella coralliicola TaxID=2592383 RepID=A0A545UI23_9GAMM|nr:chemotaxis protein CheW [Aliikangiella coralliicola]TQV89073.1 hypothetical protein FLL46_05970 [Aliikangiella coralliicola]
MTDIEISSSEKQDSGLILPSQALSIKPAKFKPLSDQSGSDANRTNQQKLNGFKVGNLNLMVSATINCQINLNSKVFPMPNGAPSLVGVTSHKGNIIPVYSIHKYLTDTEVSLKNNLYLLIFKIEESYVAIYSDTLPVRKQFSTSQLKSDSLDINKKLKQSTSNVYQENNGEIWFQLDGGNFFRQLSKH